MLVATAVLTAVSVAALVAALIVGSGLIAWACVGLCAIGLLLLLIDSRRARIKKAKAAEPDDMVGVPASAQVPDLREQRTA